VSDIYLHTDNDGAVWGLRTGDLPQPLAGSVADYVQSHDCRDSVGLRSCRSNDTLQYELLCRGAQVQAAGSACSSNSCDPFQLLLRLSSCFLPASLGGWWSCGATDLLTHRLRYDPGGYRLHPVLSELTELGNYEAISLLVSATDPRRFIDPAKPTSVSRFKSFLGLRPRMFFSGQPHPFLRCLDNWQMLSDGEAFQAVEDLTLFIWRRWLKLVNNQPTHNR
jgi:hypothetical protein